MASCPKCGAAFTRQVGKAATKRLSSGKIRVITPRRCGSCGYKFSQVSDLDTYDTINQTRH